MPAIILAAGVMFAFTSKPGTDIENCPLKGTADCPLVKECADKGTPECKYASDDEEVADCCKKK